MFTKQQILEIGNKLTLLAKKDTDFDEATLPLTGEEWIVLVQNGKNVKTKVKNLGGNFQPDDPNDPDNPGEPSGPDDPNNPNEPDDPDVPDIPDIPDEPDIPDNPDVPDEPDVPDVPTYDPPKLYVSPDIWKVKNTGGTLEVHLDPRNADESTLRAINVADDIECKRFNTTRIFYVTMPENKTSNIRYETITFSVVGLDGTTAEAIFSIEQEATINTEEDKVASASFDPAYLTFNYNDVGVSKEIRGSFLNCTPLNGVTDNYIKVDLVEDLGMGLYKFKVTLLKENNTPNQVSYTGKIRYVNLEGYEDQFTFKVNVGGAPKGIISMSDYTLRFPSNAESKTLVVMVSNVMDTNITYVNPNDWVSVEKTNETTFRIAVSSNLSSSERSGNISFSATGLDGNKVGATLQVIQEGKSEAGGGETETPIMYSGYINTDLANEFSLLDNGLANIYDNVNGDVLNRGIEMGIITKEPLKEKGKTLFPDTPRDVVLIFAIPHSSTMNVYKDQLNNPIPFDHSQLHVNGETVVMIGNEAYRLYGEYQSNNIGVGDQAVDKYYYIQ